MSGGTLGAPRTITLIDPFPPPLAPAGNVATTLLTGNVKLKNQVLISYKTPNAKGVGWSKRFADLTHESRTLYKEQRDPIP